jgi:hypothetical protein
MNNLVPYVNFGYVQQAEYIIPLQQPVFIGQYRHFVQQQPVQQAQLLLKPPNPISYAEKSDETTQADHQLALKRYAHNQDFLKYVSIGDIVQYHTDEEYLQYERDVCWSLYVGNQNLVMLKCSTIVIESVFNLTKQVFLSINKDFERTFYQLPIRLTLNRAFNALKHRQTMSNQFSTDKNFVMWCKFDINKSDIDFSTNNNRLTSAEIKYMTIQKFLSSVDAGVSCDTCDESTSTPSALSPGS